MVVWWSPLMILNPASWNLGFESCLGGQYTIRFRSLLWAYSEPFPSGVAHLVPEQLNIMASTGAHASWLIIAALRCVWPQFQWYPLAYPTKSIQLHDSIVIASPSVILHNFSLVGWTSIWEFMLVHILQFSSSHKESDMNIETRTETWGIPENNIIILTKDIDCLSIIKKSE